MRLQAAGYLLVVITNQSGIARGLYTEADYLQLTAGMQQRLAAAGVQLSSGGVLSAPARRARSSAIGATAIAASRDPA